MPTDFKTQQITRPAIRAGQPLSGLVILIMPFEEAFEAVPWSIVTVAMNKVAYGPSEALARSLGVISIICTLLYSFPPTSFVGAILLAGSLGGAVASHARIDSPLFAHVLFGVYLGVMLWGGLRLGEGTMRAMLPFAR